MNKLPLYDAMLSGKVVMADSPGATINAVRQSIVFDVTNVALLYANSSKMEWGDEDFHGAIPPYGYMWLEWSEPAPEEFAGLDQAKLRREYAPGCRGATSIVTYDREKTDLDTLLANAERHMGIKLPIGQDVRWLAGIKPFVADRTSSHFAGVTVLQPFTARGEALQHHILFDRAQFTHEYASQAANGYVHVSLLALGLMNCKNVGHVERDGVVLRKRVNRAPSKWKYKYRVLTISPMGQKPSNGSEGEAQGSVSMHFCRGNFARYTEEKPLFGKYVGTYWRPAHLKGNVKVGVVDKDYAVKPA